MTTRHDTQLSAAFIRGPDLEKIFGTDLENLHDDEEGENAGRGCSLYRTDFIRFCPQDIPTRSVKDATEVNAKMRYKIV